MIALDVWHDDDDDCDTEDPFTFTLLYFTFYVSTVAHLIHQETLYVLHLGIEEPLNNGNTVAKLTTWTVWTRILNVESLCTKDEKREKEIRLWVWWTVPPSPRRDIVSETNTYAAAAFSVKYCMRCHMILIVPSHLPGLILRNKSWAIRGLQALHWFDGCIILYGDEVVKKNYWPDAFNCELQGS